MSANWTLEQINALAPDAASLKAAQKLTASNKWPLLECNQLAVWGHCQGSGSKPYQTRIDLSEPAFKCSCPSRKFPCKHGLALFALYVDKHDDFSQQQQAPDWVQEWLDSRQVRKTKKAERDNKPPDPEAQAKRQAKRAEKIDQGIAQLELWLQDLVRNGFAELADKPYRFWDDMRARLIDAQAPGLAGRIEQLSTIVLTSRGHGDDWAERLTAALGELHLLLQAYRRLNDLSPNLRAEVRSLIGWPQSKDEVLQNTPVEDDWAVLSNQVNQSSDLLTQRIWLIGQTSQRAALILNFAHTSNRSGLALGLLPGKVASGPLYFYSSSVPLRALNNDLTVSGDIRQLAAADTINQALQHYHKLLLLNPWLRRYPLVLEHIRIVPDRQQIWLADQHDTRLMLHPQFTRRWSLLAVSGGHRINLAGEWDGHYFMPLGVYHQHGYSALLQQQEIAA